VKYFVKGRYFSGIMSSIDYLKEKLKKISWRDCASTAQSNCIQKIRVESVTLRTADSVVIVSDSREKYVVRLTATMDELSSTIKKSTTMYCRATPRADMKLLLGVD
jgi:hypothetical protein